jgi:peptidoglycan/LPS O-acetylase OafA/YrhL
VIGHYYVWCAPQPVSAEPPLLGRLLDQTSLAVHLFFGLSGFVIVYNYAGLEWRAAPLRSAAYFMWLRFARLYPAYLLFIVVASQQQRAENSLKWTLLHLASLQSWLPAKAWGALPIDGIYHVSWSISTEWGLYIAFVAAAVITARFGLAALAGLVVASGFSIWCFPEWGPWLPHLGETLTLGELWRWFYYLSPLYRLIDFGVGAALAYVVMHRPEIMSRRHIERLSAPLSARPLLFIGECSFSLYLFHFAAPRVAFMAEGFFEIPTHLLNMLLTLIFAIGLASGLYWIVERPARRLLRKHAPQYPKAEPGAAASTVPFYASSSG